MGQLIYTGIGSLDGFIADLDGDFNWSAPSEEILSFINHRDRAVAAELYGRRLYQVLQVWETYGTDSAATTAEREYGETWRNRDKVVFSTTLHSVDTSHTRLENSFEPTSVRRFVDDADGDVNIGGPALAAHALRAGIVDRFEYYVNPVVLGAGKQWLPGDLRVNLRLTEEHRFDNGVVFLAYEVR
ncbi:MAG: dihydrofolate reductase family protein [Propionibacteriaceae bacterium]|nr:dihydrofolate reductase family protein [Propionibacteriaceae bacterium]